MPKVKETYLVPKIEETYFVPKVEEAYLKITAGIMQMLPFLLHSSF